MQKKQAQSSGYQQITKLYNAIRRLAHFASKAPGDSEASQAIKGKVNNLLQDAHKLYYAATYQGLGKSTSAGFRNSIEEKLESLLSFVRQQEYNPYENSVYSIVENAAPAILTMLNHYVPTDIAAQKELPKAQPKAPTGLVPGQPGYSSAPPRHNVSLPEKAPWEYYEKESYPAPPGYTGRVPAGPEPEDIGAAKKQEKPFAWPPAGIIPPASLTEPLPPHPGLSSKSETYNSIVKAYLHAFHIIKK